MMSISPHRMHRCQDTVSHMHTAALPLAASLTRCRCCSHARRRKHRRKNSTCSSDYEKCRDPITCALPAAAQRPPSPSPTAPSTHGVKATPLRRCIRSRDRRHGCDTNGEDDDDCDGLHLRERRYWWPSATLWSYAGLCPATRRTRRDVDRCWSPSPASPASPSVPWRAPWADGRTHLYARWRC